MSTTASAATIPAEQLLAQAIEEHGREFAVVTSFQREGMVLVDMVSRLGPDARVMTIDTGRLPESTLAFVREVEERYGIRIERIQPDSHEVEAMLVRHGCDLFRNEVALRMLCCQIRKVRPLDRELAGLRSYAVGLRRGQSETRSAIEQVEYVGERRKLSPLAHWTSADVSRYISEHQVPEHPLYGAGYATIGCDPCTRPISAGEDERAGRWWWETDAAKECGLHFSADGRARRRVDVLLEEILNTHHA